MMKVLQLSNTQKEYIGFLDNIQEEIKKLKEISINPESLVNSINETIDIAKQELEEFKLYIPVIGAFSAGKSSVLNSFIEKNILPVGISPETSLATELVYNTEENIFATSMENGVEKFTGLNFTEVTKNANKYESMQVNINSQSIRDIEPLVLVDMPGFNSPLDAHNKAIGKLIDKGAFYIVLISVEEGGITKQVLDRLQQLVDLNREFCVCLSKSDIKSPSDVLAVADLVSSQVRDYFGKDQIVLTLNQSNAKESFNSILESVHPETLTKNILSPTIKSIYFQVDAGINTVLSTFDKNALELKKNQDEAKKALSDIQGEFELQVAKQKSTVKESHINSILSGVRRSLEDNITQLTQDGMASQENLSASINNIVQSSLISGINKARAKISDETIGEFSKKIESVIKPEFSIPEDKIINFIGSIKDPLVTAFTSKVLSGPKNTPKGVGKNAPKDASAGFSPVSGIIALASGANPVIALVVTVLPTIIDTLFDYFANSNQKQQIENTLRTQAFPSVITQLRPEVSTILIDSAEHSLKSIKDEYQKHLEQQIAIVAEAEKNYSERSGQIEAEKSSVIELRNRLRKSAEAIIFN